MKEKVLMAIIVGMLLLQCGLIQKLLGDKLGFFCSNSFELVFSVNLYTGKGGGSSFYFQKGVMTLIKFLTSNPNTSNEFSYKKFICNNPVSEQ